MTDWKRPVLSSCHDPRNAAGCVLHVIVPEPPGEVGGADLHVLDLAKAQLAKGPFVPVVLSTSNHEYAARLVAAGLPHFPGHLFPRFRTWFNSLATLPKLLPIRLLHSHGYDADYLTCLLRVLYPRRWGGIPTVMTAHGWVEDTLIHRAKTAANFFCYRHADAVIVCSLSQRGRISSRPDRVHFVPNGIRLPAEGSTGGRNEIRARYRIPAGRFLIGTVGRLSGEKRQDLFLRVCHALVSVGVDTHGLIVGAGTERKPLEVLSRKLGLADRVTFTGLVHDTEMIYRALSVLVVTSDTEGTPRVVPEAFSHCVPVVSTRVGGVPQLIKDGLEGLLAERGDVEGLARHVHVLLADSSLAVRMGAAGRVRVEQEFTVERMAERVEDVYRTVCLKERGNP